MYPRYGRGVFAAAAATLITLAQAASALAATPAPQNGDIVLFAKNAAPVTGAWSQVADTTAAAGTRVATVDVGAPKLSTPAAAPGSYFEIPFTAEAGRAYRLWIRARAENDSWQNDSVFVQFSGSLDAAGAPAFRIGTTTATVVSLEEGSGAGVAGWGWQDNGYGLNVYGPAIYFDGTAQKIRVQLREDGMSIDQIVLSAVQFATAAPGAAKNDTTIFPEPPQPKPEIVLHAKEATAVQGAWMLTADTTAAGGQRLANADAGVAKLAAALVAPASYFELKFLPEAGKPYRLWIRGKAANDSWQNDSTFVQFSGSVDAAGAPAFRIGTTSATVVSIEEGSGAGVAGWGWQDNGYGLNVFGQAIYFDGTPQTLRVQVREDGLSIDQIVLSEVTYATTAPGLAKNDTTILASTSGTGTPGTTGDPTGGGTGGGDTGGGTGGTGDTGGGGIGGAGDDPVVVGPKALRVLQWNTHHGGYGTDNIYDTDRLATWIVKMTPDVVMLNEIEKFTGWGNQDQPAIYRALLEQKTGKTWYAHFAQEWGQWTANGKGNLILSTVPFDFTSQYELVHNADRNIAEAVITWNGKKVTLLLTHLDPDSQDLRLVQAQEVTALCAPLPENRIITGDMNAWPDQSSIAHFNTYYNDTWAVAAAQGTALAFTGNDGQTKKGRIDYIYLSKGSADLTVVSSQVYDTRDANGYMPSDHRPVVTTFMVR
jgi:endonuclease/exonuclease/phosphatase family metal-dependent hydrolase